MQQVQPCLGQQHAGISSSSTSNSSTSRPQPPLQTLDFSNSSQVFAMRSTGELLRMYGVLKVRAQHCVRLACCTERAQDAAIPCMHLVRVAHTTDQGALCWTAGLLDQPAGEKRRCAAVRPSRVPTGTAPQMCAPACLPPASHQPHSPSSVLARAVQLSVSLSSDALPAAAADALVRTSRRVLGDGLTFGVMRHTFMKQFCAGEDEADIMPTINMLRANGIRAIIDYAAEDDSPAAAPAAAAAPQQAQQAPSAAAAATEGTGSSSSSGVDAAGATQWEPAPNLVAVGRQYSYENEATCDKHVQVFLKAIDTVANLPDQVCAEAFPPGQGLRCGGPVCCHEQRAVAACSCCGTACCSVCLARVLRPSR